MHVEFFFFVNSTCISYKCRFFYLTVMFPKLDALLNLLGISPLNPTDIMATFRNVASQAVTIRKEDSSVLDIYEISKIDIVRYVIYVIYQKRDTLVRDLCEISGRGIVRYVI